ncbi:MAG: Gfo/Idh/MocA family oxidoreductase [bacterium]
MLKVAVIGTGYMGRRHLDGYRKLPTVQIVGGACRSEATASRIKSEYSIPVYLDYREMIEAAQPDAVSICSPTPLHCEMATYTLNRSIATLVEKPFAETKEEAQQIINTAQKHNTKLMVAHTDIYDPGILKLITLVAKGYAGDVRGVEYRKVGRDISPGDVEKGIVEQGMESEQEVIERVYNLLIHITYVVDKLANSGEPLAVATPELSARRYRELVKSEINYANGVAVRILIDGTVDAPLSKLILVRGSKGEARWELKNGNCTISLITPDGMRRIPFTYASPFDNVVKYFVEFIEKNIPPFTPGEDGLKIMELSQRIIDVFRGGK